MRKLQGIWSFDVEYIDSYPLDDFLRSVVGQGADRCEACYRIRLDMTAETAKKMGLDGFTTSLLVSPYQKFAIINRVGNEMAGKHGIAFYSEDFRKGWPVVRRLSAELELYRQKYCGCIYSEMERYRKKDSPGGDEPQPFDELRVTLTVMVSLSNHGCPTENLGHDDGR